MLLLLTTPANHPAAFIIRLHTFAVAMFALLMDPAIFGVSFYACQPSVGEWEAAREPEHRYVIQPPRGMEEEDSEEEEEEFHNSSGLNC